ncbi:MAG: hypothetical protein ACE5KE_03265, partial [Methanosarcinales archaeon]
MQLRSFFDIRNLQSHYLIMIAPKKNLLIKAEDTTDPKYGCIPSERPIEEYLNKGVVNIDKP